jgi:hypothetical protein
MIDEGWFGSDDSEIDAHDLILVPRSGVEVGGKIKVRAMVEAPLYLRLNGSKGNEMDVNNGGGFAMSLAVAAVF